MIELFMMDGKQGVSSSPKHRKFMLHCCKINQSGFTLGGTLYAIIEMEDDAADSFRETIEEIISNWMRSFMRSTLFNLHFLSFSENHKRKM